MRVAFTDFVAVIVVDSPLVNVPTVAIVIAAPESAAEVTKLTGIETEVIKPVESCKRKRTVYVPLSTAFVEEVVLIPNQ